MSDYPDEWHPVMKQIYEVNDLHDEIETEVARARIDDAIINLKSALEAEKRADNSGNSDHAERTDINGEHITDNE